MGANTGATLGGLAGAAFGPMGIAVGAGLGSALVDAPAANARAADAAGRAAEAQLAEERRTREMAMNAAGPSPMELQQLERSIQLNEQDLTRKQRLIDSADPALLEAGKQALGLLQGQDAKVLEPIRRSRAKQRQILADTMAQRLGSGWETSSAGIQAMRNFDEATDNVLAGAQQQTMAQLLGVAQDTSARYGTDANLKNSLYIANARGNINSRQVNAITGNRIDNAGAPYVSEIMNARGQANQANMIGNLGMTMAGMFGGGGRGFSNPFGNYQSGSMNFAPTGGKEYALSEREMMGD